MSLAGTILFSSLYNEVTANGELYRFLEGIVRGYRNSLLTGQNYSNLTQCETIDGDIYSCDASGIVY